MIDITIIIIIIAFSQPKKSFEWEFKAGTTNCKFRFTLYSRGDEEDISDGEDEAEQIPISESSQEAVSIEQLGH